MSSGRGTGSDLTLSIDVGTGSVRAALVDPSGTILAIAAVEQHQIVPAFGWAEQSVEGWWSGVVQAIRTVLDQVPGSAGRIAAVCACGQMHGTVLVDVPAGRVVKATAAIRTFGSGGGGEVKSSIHWDMVLMQTPEAGGGEIWFDDRLIRKDGRFVLPELQPLNPENLK